MAVQGVLRTVVQAKPAVFDAKVFGQRIRWQFQIGQYGSDIDHIAEFSIDNERILAHTSDTGQQCSMAHGKDPPAFQPLSIPIFIRDIGGQRDGFTAYFLNGKCPQVTDAVIVRINGCPVL